MNKLTTEQIQLELKLNMEQAQKSLKETKDKVSELKEQLFQLAASNQKGSEAWNKTTAALKEAEKELSAFAKESKQADKIYTDFLTHVKTASDTNGNSIRDLQREAKKLQAELNAQSVGTEKYNDLLLALGKVEVQLEAEKKTQKEIAQAIRDKSSVAQVAGRIEQASLRDLRTAAEALNRQIETLTPNTQEWIAASRNLELVEARIEQIGKSTNEIDMQSIPSEFAKAFNAARTSGEGFFASLKAGMSSLNGALTTLGPIAAITTIVSGLVLAYNQLSQLTKQFTGLRNDVANITGAVGDELEEITNKTKTVSEAFDVDFKEVLVAANTVAKEFGINTTQALDLIRDGLIKGSNLNGEFLDQLREYPTQMREAGFSAQETFAILNKAVTEGIYSDKGLDSLKEAQLRIKNGEKAAIEGLDAIGLNGKELQKNLQNGTITLKKVVEDVGDKLKNIGEGSAVAQKAISDIFSAPGEDAGRRWLQIISNVNQITKDYTSNLTDAQKRILESTELTERQNAALHSITLQLGSSTSVIGNLFAKIKTGVLEGLAAVIDFFSFFKENIAIGVALFRDFLVNTFGEGTAKMIVGFINRLTQDVINPFLIYVVQALPNAINKVLSYFGSEYKIPTFTIGKIDFDVTAADARVNLSKAHNEELKRLEKERAEMQKRANTEIAAGIQKGSIASKSTETAVKSVSGSIAALRDEVNKLNTAFENAPPEEQRAVAERLQTATVKLAEAEALLNKARKEAAGRADDVPTLQQNVAGSIATQQQTGQVDIIERSPEFWAEWEAKRQDLQTDIAQAAEEKRLENTKQYLAAAVQVAQIAADAIFQIQAQNDERLKQRQLKSIDTKYAKELAAAKGNEKETAAIQKKIDAEKAAVERAAFERNKNLQIKQAIINGALAITSILAQWPKVDAGISMGIAIGVAAATTAAQVAVIANTKFQKGAVLSPMYPISSDAATNMATLRAITSLPNKRFAKGGIATGPSHDGGGIKLINSQTGQMVGEMEGGEAYMILSKETTSKNYGLIEALLSESLSGRNRKLFASGGVVVPAGLPSVNFQREALYVPAEQAAKQTAIELNPLLAEMQAMRQAFEQLPRDLKAHIVYTEIEETQSQVNNIRDFAGVK